MIAHESHQPQVSVALITGATSGIGRALALSLSASGHALGIVGRTQAALDALAEKMTQRGSRVVGYPTDLMSDDALRELSRRVADDFDRIDVLIHSAGLFARGGVVGGTIEDFDALFRVNVRAPFLLTQLLLPMVRKCKGQIVFINSSVATGPTRAGQAVYAAGKCALRAVADGLRAEVNADGVRVLTVYPRRTATPMQSLVHRLEGKDYRPERLLQPDDVAQAILTVLTLPPTAEITEVSLRPMLKDG